MADALLNSKSEFNFDGRRLLEILRRRPLLVAACTVLAPLAAFVYVSRQAPIYQATASLVVDSTTPQYLGQSFRDVVDVENNWWSSQEYLATQYRIIQSRSTAEATARALCTKRPDGTVPTLPDGTPMMAYLTGDPTCTQANIDKAAALVAGKVSVEPVHESRVVQISVRDANPHAAALLANTLSDTYKKQNLERRLEATEGAASWLGDEYGDLAVQLRNAEEALVNFKRKNQILTVALDDQQNETVQHRHKIVDELSTVQIKLIELNAEREEYASLRDADPLKDTSPALQNNPVVQRLKEAYATEYQKLIELQGKYLDKHPAIVAQRARLDAIRADLANEARLAMRALDKSYETTKKQEHDLQMELEKTTRQGLALEQLATEYNRLKRNFERLQKLSEQVGGREKESSLAAHLKTNNVYVLDAAQVPATAIKPNPLVIASAAMLAGFLVGFGLAFLLDMLDATVKTQDDIEERLQLNFLGVIPRISASEKEPVKGPVELFIQNKPKSPVAECCRAIRTSLLFMSPDRPLHRLLITSGEPQEGKSTTAVNLAITMAQSGQRVLLVDTDMRRPRMHKIFKVPNTMGFSSLIAGEREADEVVRTTEVPNLWVMPCGAIPPNPAELLHSERCKRVVDQLAGMFDRVIFDSPPLGVVTDAAILAQMCDGTVLVAKAATTSREVLGRARKILVDLKTNILGCVLNDLDLLNRSGYGYRYYLYRYGQYYGDDHEKPASTASGG